MVKKYESPKDGKSARKKKSQSLKNALCTSNQENPTNPKNPGSDILQIPVQTIKQINTSTLL
jgi:hypothetical protein